MKTLILTEKPSVAREFASTLGTNYKTENGFIELDKFIITWAIGHLLTPFDPDDYDVALKKWDLGTLPIVPKKFRYKSIKSTKSQLDVIKKIFKRNDINRLIVATDAGREGELIARLILNEVKSKLPALRFFTSDALTKEVILNELKKARPLADYDRLYIAGRARQIADWLVGMNLSRVVSIKLGDLYSVGRVQTAVLDLIVERRREIDTFVAVNYFELKARFNFENDFLDAYWFNPKVKLEDKRLNHRVEFENIVKKLIGKSAKVVKRDEVERTHYSEGLYSLTDLQRKANSEFGFSAAQTLELAQSLYEKHKVLSYPRTDAKVMGTSSIDLIKDLVYKFKELYPDYFEKFLASKVSVKNKIVFDDSRLTDHHGLIPLKNFSGSPHSPEGKIYFLVLKRFVSNFLENHRFLEVDFEIECENEFFKTKARKILEMGFKSLDETFKDDIIKDINLGDKGVYFSSDIENKSTRPPFEYTESSLLYDMTNPARLVDESVYKKIFRTEIGLGTQSTRANIIETLIKRLYIVREGKNLKAISKGIELITKLKANKFGSEIASIKETAKWELALMEMAQGDLNDEKFVEEISQFVTDAVEEWKSLATMPKQYVDSNLNKNSKELGICPICGKGVINNSKSFSCAGWREGCKFAIWKMISGAKISDAEARHIIANKKSHLIKSFKSKAGKPFSAYLVLDTVGKLEFQFESSFDRT